VAGIKSTIEKSRDVHRNFLSHLEEAENATIRKTETYWKTFYLRGLPGLFSAETWDELPTSIEHWKTIDKLWWNVLKSPDDGVKWRKLLLKGLLLALGIIFAASVAVVKILGRLPRRVSANGLLAAWILFCCWVSATLMDENISFVVCPIVFAVSEILLSSALVCLHICMRGRADEERQSSTSALWLLWVASAIGLVLRTAVTPYAIALVVWIVCLLLCFMCLRGKALPVGRLFEKVYTTSVAYSFLALGFLALVGFLPSSLLVVSVAFYVSVTTELGVDFLRFLRRLNKRAEQKYSEVPAYFIGIVVGIGYPVIILALVYLNLWLLSLRLGGEPVLDGILSTEAGWHDYHISFKSLALMILGYYVTKSVVFVSEFVVRRFSNNREELDPAVVEALRTTAKYLCWGFFTICVLSLLGFNLTSLTVVAGGLSVGIGFGLQHIVNNLFSGLILLVGRSIQSGDTIQIEGMLGEVRKVTIRNTIVQTRDNATLFVPNSDLITNKLINWSHRDRRVVRRIAVGVAYGSDTEKIRKLLLQAAASHPRVLSDPPPKVLFSDFGASTLDFKVEFWIDDVDNEHQVLSDLRYCIDRLFRENDVEIAFPQSTLHLQTAPALEKLLSDRMQEQPISLREPAGIANPMGRRGS
jgi:small-conductance mechanosensitive channel